MDPLPEGTVERWAREYVAAESLAHKLAPPPPPRRWLGAHAPLRIAAPGRPPELRVVAKTRRSLAPAQLAQPRRRAQLLHTLLHHELQAAELLCWAILAFPAAPLRFRQGLLGICRDELRHLDAYAAALATLGYRAGDFPVRDWFWSRVTACATPLQFVALLGLGLEGANLDHMPRLAAALRAAGDPASAGVLAAVGREEIAHVRFAARWFVRWTGGLEFARWQRELPPPLTHALLRGRPIDRAARAEAGLPPAFLDALAAP